MLFDFHFQHNIFRSEVIHDLQWGQGMEAWIYAYLNLIIFWLDYTYGSGV